MTFIFFKINIYNDIQIGACHLPVAMRCTHARSSQRAGRPIDRLSRASAKRYLPPHHSDGRALGKATRKNTPVNKSKRAGPARPPSKQEEEGNNKYIYIGQHRLQYVCR